MRDMTEDEKQIIEKGICTHCGSTEFFAGPCGGICQNFDCVTCGMRINIAPMNGKIIFGQMLSEPAGYIQPDAKVWPGLSAPKESGWQRFRKAAINLFGGF